MDKKAVVENLLKLSDIKMYSKVRGMCETFETTQPFIVFNAVDLSKVQDVFTKLKLYRRIQITDGKLYSEIYRSDKFPYIRLSCLSDLDTTNKSSTSNLAVIEVQE